MRTFRQGDETSKGTDSLNGDDLLAMDELIREANASIKMLKRAEAKGLRERDIVTAK